MPDGLSQSDRRPELLQVIHKVRSRWRLRLALRGPVMVVAGTVLALCLSASSLEARRSRPAAITSFRLFALFTSAALASIGLSRPLLRQVNDNQVALYLEECDPTLQAAILSAVETSGLETGGDAGPSPKLVEKLVEQAIERCRALDDGLIVERQGLKRQMYTLGTVGLITILLVTFGPAFLRHGLSALLIISRSAVEASPYRIEVTPGDAKIPRGSDQAVKAKLFGFSSSDATLMMRTGPDAPF